MTFGVSKKASDEEIYNLAAREKLFVLTVNYKDFKKLVKPTSVGIIGIPGDLSNEEMDDLVCKFIKGKNPEDYYGKATMINDEVI